MGYRPRTNSGESDTVTRKEWLVLAAAIIALFAVATYVIWSLIWTINYFAAQGGTPTP